MVRERAASMFLHAAVLLAIGPSARAADPTPAPPEIQLQRPRLPSLDRAVRGHPPRRGALPERHRAPGRLLHGLGALRLHARLADRAVPRLRRQPRIVGAGDPRAVGPPVLLEAVVRAPALISRRATGRETW